MNKLQKKMVVFLFILAFLVSLSTFKVLKMVVGDKKKIAELSDTVANLTQKGQALSEKLKEKEEEITQAKLDIEDLTSKLADEKTRSESFEANYKTEKERGDGLETDLNKVKLDLEEMSKEKEKLALDVEKLKEEKDSLSKDVREVRQAKEALEAFVAEGKGKEEKAIPGAIATTTISSGRILTVYPQGLLAIKVEKDSQDKTSPGKIVKGEKEIKLSKIHDYILTLETAEDEDLSGLKKDDLIKYVR